MSIAMPAGLESLRRRRRGQCTGTTFVNELGTSVAYDVCWVGDDMVELEITVYCDAPGQPDDTARQSFVVYGTQDVFGKLGEILSAVGRYRPQR
jgi:hypothetical protein